MRDRIIFAITITICIVILIGVVTPLISDTTYDENKFKGVVEVIKSLIALIAFYLGQSTVNKQKDNK